MSAPPIRPSSAATQQRLNGSIPPPVIGNYSIGRTVGKGSFGKVKEAVFIPTGDKVAVKILNRKMLTSTSMDKKIAREIKILKLFSHNNICRLYDVIATSTDILVFMEFVPGKELYDVIVERGKFNEPDARHVFQQLLCAVEYCHHYRVVHRDLKPENILLGPSLTVKLIDFGLANIMQDSVFLRTSCGSPNYAAPEVISGKLYVGPEIDVWSCGVILYALLCGCLPFDEDTIPLLFQKIKAGRHAPIPPHVSPEAKDLLKRLLVVDPLERITIPQLRDHPWFTTNLPRSLMYRPSLFDNASVVDETVLPAVAKLTQASIGKCMELLSAKHDLQHLSTAERSIVVSYNIMADAKRRTAIELMNKEGGEAASSGTTYTTAVTAAQRELNLGLMLTTSPAVAMLLDHNDAASNKRQYNTATFVPQSMQDVKSLQQDKVKIAASPGTFCFTGNPSSYTERVGSLQHSLATSAPRRDNSTGQMTGGVSLSPNSDRSTQLVGSVAKPRAVYDAGEEAVAIENSNGWRVGFMTDITSAAAVREVFNVLREYGMEWRSPSPFVIRARYKKLPDAMTLQMQLLRLRDKHDRGYVVDFQVVRGNSILGLEASIQLANRLVMRVG